MAKQIWDFGGGGAEGSASMVKELGGKGANLAEMSRLGLPVPPGFTLGTRVCLDWFAGDRKGLGEALLAEVRDAVARVEEAVGRRFGDPAAPLLFSVRSGARASMPGMMDTVLNLGLNDRTVEGLAELTDNRRFALDSYRRFLQMFGDVVLDVPAEHFEEELDRAKERAGATLDTGLGEEELAALVKRFQALIVEHAGQPFPQDPTAQLEASILAVFRSWENPRAVAYRKMHGIPDEWGTAVNVQAMVFGNMGDDCATGVAFSRDPATGEDKFYGEYLLNAQGEDVVAGVRTPQRLRREGGGETSLEATMPEAYAELAGFAKRLEDHYRDLLDLEFTIERGKLWMLQVRVGKRTGRAAVRCAVEMVDEGLIRPEEALLRVAPSQLDQLLHPSVDPSAQGTLLGQGLPASPGAASGRIVLSAEEAERAAGEGQDVILVRRETSPEDVLGMAAAVGILTQRGGMTSHAAVVARGWGKCCVCGVGELRIDTAEGTVHLGGKRFRRGDILTLNGNTGEVLEGEVPTIPPQLDENFRRLLGWADGHRRLRVRANADTPADASQAREFGAEGIGLCRTEHMFFGEERIGPMREMILAADDEQRQLALDQLLPFQVADFQGIFAAMDGLPVTIRLLDPPLHEFLPHDDVELGRLAGEMGRDPVEMAQAVSRLSEFNPMLGHRGCRLGLSHPAIYGMQATAIVRAAIAARREGIDARPEIMVPLVGTVEELRRLRALVVERAGAEIEAAGVELAYTVGTMIEIPRACLVAGDIAAEADFFSFGTNDLTQMGFGYSRDDSASFLPEYVRSGILPADPFQSLDVEGIGQLVTLATEDGRAAKPGLKVGVCGEHGGDPDSVRFFHGAGLDYVSCSPFRVPVAILAAAHAALGEDVDGRD